MRGLQAAEYLALSSPPVGDEIAGSSDLQFAVDRWLLFWQSFSARALSCNTVPEP